MNKKTVLTLAIAIAVSCVVANAPAQAMHWKFWQKKAKVQHCKPAPEAVKPAPVAEVKKAPVAPAAKTAPVAPAKAAPAAKPAPVKH